MSEASDAITVSATGSGVSLERSPYGGDILRLVSAAGVAEIALQGGQVLSWQPRGHAPVIWMSPMERLGRPLGNPKPVRGGTPICWPWFAAHPLDATKPAHGFVRTRNWTLEGAHGGPGQICVRLSTAATEVDKAVWPHSGRVELLVTLGETLALALTTHNTGHAAFDLTQALHTYFVVGDIADVTVEGFDGLDYLDKLADNERKKQTGAIGFTGEVDRIYDDHSGAAAIVDRGLRRRIEITKAGSQSSVVWNPWLAKSQRLGDMGPHGYRGMVCVETTNAGKDIVHIRPGGVHTMSAEYRVVGI